MSYENKFIFSLFLTLLTEVPLVALMLKKTIKNKENKLSEIFVVAGLASILTLPYLWFVLPYFISERIVYVYGGEILVIFIEFLIYRYFLKLKTTKAFAVSLFSNLVSIIVGLLL